MATATLKQETSKQDTALADADTKLYDLQQERDAIKTTIANLRPAVSSIEQEAVALLSGKRDTVTDHREQRERLARELAVTEAAIDLQRHAVAKEQARERDRQRVANRPEHAALLRDLAVKLKEAEAAAVKLERFYIANDNAVDRTMRFAPFGEFDPQTNRFENIERWEAEGREFEVFKS